MIEKILLACQQRRKWCGVKDGAVKGGVNEWRC